MPAAAQLEFLHEGVTDADVEALRGWLATHGWQSRKQLHTGLGWSERKIRDVAELMGSGVVRSQVGFRLTEQITRDDVSAALQAAQAAISQGKRMIRYGIALKNRLHEVIG
jgi:hypothetical protein